VAGVLLAVILIAGTIFSFVKRKKNAADDPARRGGGNHHVNATFDNTAYEQQNVLPPGAFVVSEHERVAQSATAAESGDYAVPNIPTSAQMIAAATAAADTSTTATATAAAGASIYAVPMEDNATYGGSSGDGFGIDAEYGSVVYVATPGLADGVYDEAADDENATNAAPQALYSVVDKPTSVDAADNNNHYDMAPPRRRAASAQNTGGAAAAVAVTPTFNDDNNHYDMAPPRRRTASSPSTSAAAATDVAEYAEVAEVASAVITNVQPGAVQRIPNPMYVPAEEANGNATNASSAVYATASELFPSGDGAADTAWRGVASGRARVQTVSLNPPRLKASRQRQPEQRQPQQAQGGGLERKVSVYAGFGNAASDNGDEPVAESSAATGISLKRGPGRGSMYAGFTNIVNEDEC